VYEPDFGFLLLRLDLTNIDAEHATFIDLDVSKVLMMEIQVNTQQLMQIDDIEQC